MLEDCKEDLHEKFGACWNCCEACNHDTHRCHFCGTDLTHNSYEHGSSVDAPLKRHWLSDCRPDLLPHEPGELCTSTTWCYGNHETGTFDFTEDGPMV